MDTNFRLPEPQMMVINNQLDYETMRALMMASDNVSLFLDDELRRIKEYRNMQEHIAYGIEMLSAYLDTVMQYAEQEEDYELCNKIKPAWNELGYKAMTILEDPEIIKFVEEDYGEQ